MSSYFDAMDRRISDLKAEDAWDGALDLERELVRDVTICAMLPGFPAQWKRPIHDVVLKYGIGTLPYNAAPRDFETFDEHRSLLHSLCQDLHIIFHEIAREQVPGFSDHPHSGLNVLYNAGDEERAALVTLGATKMTADTIESNAADLLTLLSERQGTWLVPSRLQPELMARVHLAGKLLEERGQAFWYCASLSEQLQGCEPYVLCLPDKSGSRFHVSVPDGKAVEPLYPK